MVCATSSEGYSLTSYSSSSLSLAVGLSASIEACDVAYCPGPRLIISSRLSAPVWLLWLRRRCLCRPLLGVTEARPRHAAISPPEPRLKRRREIDRSRPEIDVNGPRRRTAARARDATVGLDRTRLDVTPVCACVTRVFRLLSPQHWHPLTLCVANCSFPIPIYLLQM